MRQFASPREQTKTRRQFVEGFILLDLLLTLNASGIVAKFS